ncbi:MAG TPA: DNA polymerase III subunit alpha [Acidobacteriota bacterium]|nr:DNA polymerase III subunit alpha [Acidobacteriota bacterium]
MYIHLHVHSAFSLLEGAFSIPQLLFRSQELQIPVIALTDTNGLYGAITFYKFAKQLGIKPIIGCCLKSEDGSAVLIAKNKSGFSQISQIVTARQLVENFSLRKDLQKLAYTSDPELFVISSDESLLKDLANCWDLSHLFAELVRSKKEGEEKQIRRLCNLAEQLRIRYVATNDVHLLHPTDHLLHRILTSVRTLSHWMDSSLPLSSEECWMKTPEEMESLFSDLPQAIKNSEMIAEQCDLNLELGKYTFPEFQAPDGNSCREFLETLCWKGLQSRYPRITGEAENRLRRELEVIRKQGFAEYFLVVWDILRYAREQNIHWVGRGSAANSIVSYALGITNVDPVRYNLFFERFLNPERKSPPDIDVDFGWKERDQILAYVYERYGHDRVAMICTYVTFSARLAVREIGKAMGLPDEEITAVSSRLPYGADAGALLKDPTQFPEAQDLPLDQEPLQLILKLAAYIDGFPRHLSIHAGGIVIAPYPITEIVPLQRAAKGLIVTQYDMYGVEDIGLVKIDLLAQRSLSVLDDVTQILKSNNGSSASVIANLYDYDFLENDCRVKELVRTGNTMGCFYIESPAMRQLLQKLRVDTFEDLTAASSVIRPGVAESGMMQQYIRRKTGEEGVSYLHPKMEALLNETFGVMIYQEDVIRVAHEIAGMSLGEADLLRRAMSGKERSPLKMDEMEQNFLKKAVEKEVDPETAKEIWRQISSFAAYAFCKAHSASFAQLSLQVTYLRAYHPADFMAAVLTNQGGFYSTMAYVEEARRMGLRILPPDVRKGGFYFAAEGPHAIRIGLMQVKDVAAKHWEIFEAERSKQGFESFTDFMLRTQFNETELENLVRCGACDSFSLNRPQMMWLLKAMYSSIVQQRDRSTLIGASIIRTPKVPRLHDYTEDQKLKYEMQLLDLAVTKHPLHLFKPWKRVRNFVPAKHLKDYKDEYVQLIGWLVTTKPSSTSKNERMLFATFEDTETLFETTLFPRTYNKCAHLLVNRGPYVVQGNVDEDHGVFSVIVEGIKNLNYER